MTEFEAVAMKDAQTAVSPDGETILLSVVDAEDHRLVVRLNGEDLSRMMALMLSTTMDAAARRGSGGPVPPLPKPLPVDSIGVGLGPSDGEAILGVRVGSAGLSFVVRKNALLALCDDLRRLFQKQVSAARH
jgi:hypothetical protein